ncbi:MAG: hypothetical protein QOF61_404, partial [Acidobacteriota bacterium]|nr:hypothetical protein [Acidobacteriota bacterium]
YSHPTFSCIVHTCGRAKARDGKVMEKSSDRGFEEFGGRVASAWRDLRPTTRTLVERALQSANAPATGGANYDARSELELSRLLEALDESAREAGAQEALSAEQSIELVRVADACAFVLHSEARSAEVFAQLLERALRARDYARVDRVADTLSTRLAPTEICELARNHNPALRAIAHEALAQKPSSVLVDLLGDPVDAEVARDALEVQADDYDSEEARWIVSTLERIDEEGMDE